MLTVTTYPDFYRNELCRTPLHANDIGMKCLGLPRTELEADFLVSEPNSKTRGWATRFPGVPLFRYLLAKGGVAVTVAVHCSTSATFQAFTSDSLCAQDFCKLFVRCDLPNSDLLTVDDS